MGSARFLSHLLLMIIPILVLSSSSEARKFDVGGKDGWVAKPSEDYNHWAHRNRFSVNDTLYFKYKKGSDSVLVVSKDDYDSCNIKNPIQRMDDGDSSFSLDRSGPFYFISGNIDNCQKGQKLLVVVMAVRPKPQSPPPATAPASPLPATAPTSPTPATARKSPSPAAASPDAESPSGSNAPAPSPASNSGSKSSDGSVGMALGFSIGVILMFGGLGMKV